jgi:ribonucleoside-diphosphate reductase alpha chain
MATAYRSSVVDGGTTSVETLSDIITWSKYARYIPELRRRETAEEIIDRNVQMHLEKFTGLGIEDEIHRVYREFVATKKVVPSMRSFQFAGEPILREGGSQRIYNCSYAPVTAPDVWREFTLLLLSGTGVGYSVQWHHVNQLPTIKPRQGEKTFVIPDSIEGWARAVDELVNSFFRGTKTVHFDYSEIRPEGAPLRTSGGRAPGSEPLRIALERIEAMFENILAARGETKLRPIEAHDSICQVSEAVLSGGNRRSALISLFSNDDEEMLNAKSISSKWWEFAPYRARANNSAVFYRDRATREDFDRMWQAVKDAGTGEPGIFWSSDPNGDYGTNPCGEIALGVSYDEDGQVDGGSFCNLTEVNGATVVDQEDLNARARAAAFLGTLQAAYDDISPLLRVGWRKKIQEERLLGVSMTGIAAGAVLDLDLEEAAEAAVRENERVAGLLGVRPARRVTTVKPSGTSSLWLSGAISPRTGAPEYVSSGIHAYHAQYILRRVRLNKNEALYQHIVQHHPDMVEDEAFDPENTAVITFPIKAPEGAITRDEQVDEMLERVRQFNTRWIRAGHRTGINRHNVSVTVSVREGEWDTVGEWLWENRDTYGGISVLPASDAWYPQLPFEETDRETYEAMAAQMDTIDVSNITEEQDYTNLQGELACQAGNCEVTDVSSGSPDEEQEKGPTFSFDTLSLDSAAKETT